MQINRIISSGVTFPLWGSQKEKSQKWAGNLFEKILAKNFPNQGKETEIQVQET